MKVNVAYLVYPVVFHLGVYDELVRMHREEDLSFADVVVFNVSEFFLSTKTNVIPTHNF